MSVRVDDDAIRLEGDCRAADAETLCAALAAHPGRAVDLSEAQALHTAVVQAILALGPPVVGEPRDPFLRTYVSPLLHALP